MAGPDDQSADAEPATETAGDSTDEPVTSPPPVEDLPEDEPHPSDGLQARGEVTAVETVDAGTVPEQYPVEIPTAEALAVEVSLGGPDEVTVVVYFTDPETGQDDRLTALLGLDDLADPADLVGRSLLVTVEEGYYVPVVPEEPPRGSARGVYGIVLGLAPSLVVGLIGIFAPGSELIASAPFVLAWFVGTFLLLPVSVYLDAIRLRSTTNWTGTPRTWTVLSVIPPLNVLVVPLYLISRENAQPLLSE